MERNERKPLRVAVYCRLARADGENIVLDAQRENSASMQKSRDMLLWQRLPRSAAAFR